MNEYAPIAIFVYRRAELVSRVLDALEACPEFSSSDVYIFSDGPKSQAAKPDVDEVRAHIRSRLRANMQLIESIPNKGLAGSIIEGVTSLCDEYGRVIVIEDDLIVSPIILTWFNRALDFYVHEQKVMQVSAHMFNVRSFRDREEGMFFPVTTSWGWATWKRAWDAFDYDANGWESLETNLSLRRQFNVDGCYPFSSMLRAQMNSELDSWAIRWYWTVFRLGGLVLFPPLTLVNNFGDDSRATHSGWINVFFGGGRCKTQRMSDVLPIFPTFIGVEAKAWKIFKRSILLSRFIGAK